MRSKKGLASWAAVVGALCGTGTARAAQHVYTLVEGSDDWNGSPNWSPALVSGVDTQLTFVGSNGMLIDDGLSNTNTNDLGAFQLNILDLQGTGPMTTAASITIASAAGSSLNFVANGGTNPTVNLNAVLTVPPPASPPASPIALNYNVTSDITLSASTTFNGNGTATFTFSGNLSGATAGLTKSGSSTLLLSGANSYTGATVINTGGAIRVLSDSALGTTAAGTTVNAGGGLQLTGDVTVTGESLSLVGDGTSGTTGALRNLGGANTWTGDITIQPAATTRIVSDSGSLTVSGNIALSTTAGDQFVLQGSGNGTVSGVISGVSKVTKSSNGGGTWTLSGANTYIGQTSISNGALSVSSINSVTGGTASSSLGAPTSVGNGTINLGGGGTSGQLIYTGPGETTDRVIRLNGTSGGGILTSNGSGPLDFTSNISAANNNKTLALGGSNSDDNRISGLIADPASGVLSVSKRDSGTWVADRAHTYSGTTTVSGGILSLRHAQGLGSTAGGTAVTTSGSLRLQGGITVAGEALSLTGDGVGSSGVLYNVSGNNTWTGNVTIETASTTRIFSEAGLLTVSGNVETKTAGNQFVLQGDGDGVISGVISGPARLTHSVTGAGTWTLSGANTYTGKTTISNGTFVVSSLNRIDSPLPSSSLGAPANVDDGVIDLGSAGVTGTLVYTGPGEATDRVINLAGTSGGGTIDASGAGAIVFESGVTAGGAGDKPLTLSGSSAAANAITGVIANNSGSNVTRLEKTGAGTWLLSGANTYTGLTSVSAGLLLINGTNGADAARTSNYSITGSAGGPATLGGTGSAFLLNSRAVTVGSTSVTADGANNGILAPGNPFAGGMGTLTIDGGDGVVFSDNSTFAVQTAATGISDLLDIVGGGIDLASTSDRLALSSTDAGVFTIAQFDGARTGVFDIVTINGISQPGAVDTVGPITTFTATSNDLLVTYNDTVGSIVVTINNPVPEPATAGLLAMAGVGLLARRRRMSR